MALIMDLGGCPKGSMLIAHLIPLRTFEVSTVVVAIIDVDTEVKKGKNLVQVPSAMKRQSRHVFYYCALLPGRKQGLGMVQWASTI